MKKSFTLVAAVLACALIAAAQEAPKFETFLGYSFVRFSTNPEGPSFLPNGDSDFNAHGGNFQLGWNFNRWLALVADGDAAHNGDIGNFARGTAVSFTAGPRVSYRKMSHFRPYAQALFGGAWYNSSSMVPLLTPVVPVNNGVTIPPSNEVITTRANQGQVVFAMLVGGGVDFIVNKHISLRPIEADYYRTKFKNFTGPSDNRQNNFRYTAGVNFTFGAR